MPACNSKKNYCLTVVATKINMLQKYHFFLKNFNIFAHFFLSLQKLLFNKLAFVT